MVHSAGTYININIRRYANNGWATHTEQYSYFIAIFIVDVERSVYGIDNNLLSLYDR